MDDQHYFQKENLWQIASLDQHLAFAEIIIKRYYDQTQVGAALSKQLDTIREIQTESDLTVSVIGEFSTGKSSFINSLLDYNILKTSAIQGTTLAQTVLICAPEYGLKVYYKSGRLRQLRYDSAEKLASDLANYSANKKNAQIIEKVEVYFPSDFLSSGVRIVDTPGINALERWQEEIARQALRECSDMSVVLLNSIQILPESFCVFLENNLSENLRQCIFVITKMDCFLTEECDQIVNYTRNKLRQRFGLTDPIIFPFSAQINDSDENCTSVYKQTKADLFRQIDRQRYTVRATRCAMMMLRVLNDLKEELNQTADKFGEEVAKNKQYPRLNLQQFLTQLQQRHEKQLEAAMPDSTFAAFNDLWERLQEEQEALFYQINVCQSELSLQQCVKTRLPDQFAVVVGTLTKCLTVHLQKADLLLQQTIENYQQELLTTDPPLVLSDFCNQYVFIQKPPQYDISIKSLGDAISFFTNMFQPVRLYPMPGRSDASTLYRRKEEARAAVSAYLTNTFYEMESLYYKHFDELISIYKIETERCVAVYDQPLEIQSHEQLFFCMLQEERRQQMLNDLEELDARRFTLQSALHHM